MKSCIWQHYFPLKSCTASQLHTDVALGETGKAFTRSAGKTNNLFMWKLFSRTAHWGNLSRMKLRKGKSSPFVSFLPQRHVNHKSLPFKRKFWNTQQRAPAPPPPTPPALRSPGREAGVDTSWATPGQWARGSTICHLEAGAGGRGFLQAS